MQDQVILPAQGEGLYKDKTFKEWQEQLEASWHDSDSESGWQLTLDIVSGFRLAIPHVECGQLDDKSGSRRKSVRSWLVGYACSVPAVCGCEWKN